MPRTKPAKTAEKPEPAGPEPPWQYADTDRIRQLHCRGGRITSTELNLAAGLDWTVYQTPAFFFTSDPGDLEIDRNGYVIDPTRGKPKLVSSQRARDSKPVPDYLLNVRSDTQHVLGIVKDRYRIFQNNEAPRFLDHLVDIGEGEWVTAGSLHRGAQVWWLLELSESIHVAGDPREAIDTYLLLTNSHDGSTSLTASVLPLRHISQTTLAWQVPQAPRSIRVKHTDSNASRTHEAERILELARIYQGRLAQIAKRLAQIPLTDSEFAAFLEELVPTRKPIIKSGRVVNQRGVTMAKNTKGIITQIYFNNPTHAHIRGTLWGAVQAAQYYSDHLTINRNTDGSAAQENRFKRLTSGASVGPHVLRLARGVLERPDAYHH